MSTEGETFAGNDRATPPLLLIAQRVAQQQLGAALERALQRCEDHLIDCEEKGRDIELTALRDLRRARERIAQRLDEQLIDGFRRLGEEPAAGATLGLSGLSLTSDDGLSEQLTAEQMVDNLAKRFEFPLAHLGKRLEKLAGRPLQARDNPCHPKFIGEAMGAALGRMYLSIKVRVALYGFLERELECELASLYQRLNLGLARAGVLPMMGGERLGP